MVVIVPECPVNKRGLAGLRRPVDNIRLSYYFAVDLAVCLTDRHHPFLAFEDLIVGIDEIDEAALVEVRPVFCC